MKKMQWVFVSLFVVFCVACSGAMTPTTSPKPTQGYITKITMRPTATLTPVPTATRIPRPTATPRPTLPAKSNVPAVPVSPSIPSPVPTATSIPGFVVEETLSMKLSKGLPAKFSERESELEISNKGEKSAKVRVLYEIEGDGKQYIEIKPRFEDNVGERFIVQVSMLEIPANSARTTKTIFRIKPGFQEHLQEPIFLNKITATLQRNAGGKWEDISEVVIAEQVELFPVLQFTESQPCGLTEKNKFSCKVWFAVDSVDDFNVRLEVKFRRNGKSWNPGISEAKVLFEQSTKKIRLLEGKDKIDDPFIYYTIPVLVEVYVPGTFEVWIEAHLQGVIPAKADDI